MFHFEEAAPGEATRRFHAQAPSCLHVEVQLPPTINTQRRAKSGLPRVVRARGFPLLSDVKMDEEDFATELRTGTRRQHDLSTAVVNLSAPLALSSPKVYRMLLVSWYWIYKTMEAEMEERRRRYPKVSAVYFRELLRTAAFEEDLRYYYGEDFPKRIGTPSKATAEYIQTFKECVDQDPMLIIAYCHTMYLGMFGGGPIVKKWIDSTFAPPPGKGSKIFDFSDTIDDVTEFQREYNEAVNRIALTREEKDRLIQRKRKIFADNDTIMAEVRGSRTYNRRLLLVVCVFLLIAVVAYCLIRILLDSTFREYVISKAGTARIHS